MERLLPALLILAAAVSCPLHAEEVTHEQMWKLVHDSLPLQTKFWLEEVIDGDKVGTMPAAKALIYNRHWGEPVSKDAKRPPYIQEIDDSVGSLLACMSTQAKDKLWARLENSYHAVLLTSEEDEALRNAKDQETSLLKQGKQGEADKVEQDVADLEAKSIVFRALVDKFHCTSGERTFRSTPEDSSVTFDRETECLVGPWPFSDATKQLIFSKTKDLLAESAFDWQGISSLPLLGHVQLIGTIVSHPLDPARHGLRQSERLDLRDDNSAARDMLKKIEPLPEDLDVDQFDD